MPSKTDFNVSPYYDDFAETKKFHRVMYRPAYAVQARELTTQQSITQNQIERMGDHLFKHGSMVIPGETTVDLAYEAVKLTSFNGTLSNYNGNTLTGGTSGVVANVVGYVATDGTDPDTLFVKYRNSGTDNATDYFTDGEILTSGHTDAMTAVCSTTATGCAVHIDAGTYYINGFFVNVDQQTLVLEKYSQEQTYRIGLTITETFITSTDDTTLLDNATGSSNANALWGVVGVMIRSMVVKVSRNSCPAAATRPRAWSRRSVLALRPNSSFSRNASENACGCCERSSIQRCAASCSINSRADRRAAPGSQFCNSVTFFAACHC